MGALAAAFRVRPEYGIAVDVTHAKTPDAPSDETFEMGKVMVGMGPNLHRGLTDRMIRTARACEIPFDIEVMEGNTGTNSLYIHVVRICIAM